ncbi:MAG: L,D-transpeptidase family protein [Epsilonproteobacteria bacterium]|nr:L,D-transpeptidase family protein [Campylobacterota bacterium]
MKTKSFFACLIFASALSFASGTTKEILVDLSEQMAYLKENGSIVDKGRISSGRRTHPTPTGTFEITEKKRHHISNLYPEPYGGAKMPYMMRLSHGKVALHAGHVAPFPVSHGCIRLRPKFAAKVFNWVDIGTSVKIVGNTLNYRSKVTPPQVLPTQKSHSRSVPKKVREKVSPKRQKSNYKEEHDDYDIYEYYRADTGTYAHY